jgi:hypothetical protein
MKWNDNEIKQLVSLFNEKMTYNEIAINMNKTYGSVRGKLQKLGYNFRDGQIALNNCLNCNKEIKTTISENKKFCNNSCSATYNNKLRNKDRFCLNCNTKVNNNYNCCSKECASEYKKRKIFELIENGDLSFSEKIYKKYLIYKYGNKCMECGWCKLHPTTGNVPIQLEHVDGNSDNNSLDNLKLLCPNCHSLTPTYGALNKNNGRDSKRKIKRQSWRLNNVGDA